MTRWRSIRSAPAFLLLAVMACGSLGGTALAAGLSTTLANGQTLSVVESSTPERVGFAFQRRYPDGAPDRQFGPGGRVFFTMGSDDGVPATVCADALGRLLVAGSARFDERSRSALVVRYLPTGRIDAAWGEQGQVRLPATRGDSAAIDVLPAADGSLLVVGHVDEAGTQFAAIWRIDAMGRVDPAFGERGTMLAVALPQSRALSVQRAPDGAVQLAVQTRDGAGSWIEMHRWPSGAVAPIRVARQALPEQWVGPAALVSQAGRWLWVDPSRPETAQPALALSAPDAPWSAAELPPIAAAETVDRPGRAAFNPYGGAAMGTAQRAPAEPEPKFWLGVPAAALLGAGAWAWWRRRRR